MRTRDESGKNAVRIMVMNQQRQQSIHAGRRRRYREGCSDPEEKHGCRLTQGLSRRAVLACRAESRFDVETVAAILVSAETAAQMVDRLVVARGGGSARRGNHLLPVGIDEAGLRGERTRCRSLCGAASRAGWAGELQGTTYSCFAKTESQQVCAPTLKVRVPIFSKPLRR